MSQCKTGHRGSDPVLGPCIEGIHIGRRWKGEARERNGSADDHGRIANESSSEGMLDVGSLLVARQQRGLD